MKRLILGLLAASVAALYGEEYTALLKKDRQVVEQQLARIEADAMKSLEAWPAEYARSLKALEEKLKKDGDLQGVLAVRKESDRFAANKQIPAEAVVETP